MIEKTEELLEEIMYCDFRTEFGVDKARTIIRRGLRSHGRDVRYSCANSILNCTAILEAPNGEDAVLLDDAHSACLNAKV